VLSSLFFWSFFVHVVYPAVDPCVLLFVACAVCSSLFCCFLSPIFCLLFCGFAGRRLTGSSFVRLRSVRSYCLYDRSAFCCLFVVCTASFLGFCSFIYSR
jgi:hypothetical protein